MPTVKGRDEVRQFIAQAPEQIAGRILPGAARAAANVVAEEAKSRSISKEVSDAIKVSTKKDGTRIIGRVKVNMGSYNLPLWLEYGTDPHFVSVDKEMTGGRTASRLNRLDTAAAKEGRTGPGQSLKINGKFVGPIVHHPGAKRHPFLRPALDTKEGEALAAAQSYINTRIARMGKTGVADGEGPDE